LPSKERRRKRGRTTPLESPRKLWFFKGLNSSIRLRFAAIHQLPTLPAIPKNIGIALQADLRRQPLEADSLKSEEKYSANLTRPLSEKILNSNIEISNKF